MRPGLQVKDWPLNILHSFRQVAYCRGTTKQLYFVAHVRVQGQSVALEKKAKTMVLNGCQEEHACTLCLASTGSMAI